MITHINIKLIHSFNTPFRFLYKFDEFNFLELFIFELYI